MGESVNAKGGSTGASPRVAQACPWGNSTDWYRPGHMIFSGPPTNCGGASFLYC